MYAIVVIGASPFRKENERMRTSPALQALADTVRSNKKSEVLSETLFVLSVLLYAFHGDRQLRNVRSVVFVILIAILTLALLLGTQRYHDKPRRDGRR